MINSSKITIVSALFLTAFALVPGWFETFDVAPDSARVTALLACALFLVGLLIGARLVPDPRPWTASERRADRSERGLIVVGCALLLCTAYVVLFGPAPPVFAASAGFDALDSALLREEAIKLNPDTVFVKIYSYTRDIFAPIVFVLTLDVLFRRGTARSTRVFGVVFLVAATFIGIWSGQKATIINYVLAAIIFVARDARALLRWLLVGLPVIAGLTFVMFAITYPDIFSNTDSEAFDNVMQGLLHRIYISPFEVSVAYVDMIDNRPLIDPLQLMPYLNRLLLPSPTIENIIGIQYFYSGIDSISANALCFAYAYVIGGLPGCLLAGILTVAVIGLSIRIVRDGNNIFMVRVFQAIVAYGLLDLLNANLFSYLIAFLQIALLAWFLARANLGRRAATRRRPGPVGSTA